MKQEFAQWLEHALADEQLRRLQEGDQEGCDAGAVAPHDPPDMKKTPPTDDGGTKGGTKP